ncbi:MAG TPA: amino acid racemase [Thermoanaerobaculia bacterium]|nr:amino acid racemase [Thermoanaerobaculia bacterium]
MKTLGIIGGIAPGSTIEYYRQIVDSYRERTNEYPSIILNSIDLKRMLGLVAAGRLEELTGYLLTEIERLALARADVGLLASNTPHIVFDEIRKRSPIPLISIVEAARDAAKARGLERLGLFGTRSTMAGSFYPDVFSRAGMVLVIPREDEQNYIHQKYMEELVNGKFLPETREGLLNVVRKMIARDRIDGLILGGTELPLILRDEREAGIALLDTTAIHVQKAVAALLA